MTTHNADLLVIHAAELLTCRGGHDGIRGGTRHRDFEARVTQSELPKELDSGIRYTVRRTRETPDAQLIERATADLDLMLAHGTTTLEAKTGYGLSFATRSM